MKLHIFNKPLIKIIVSFIFFQIFINQLIIFKVKKNIYQNIKLNSNSNFTNLIYFLKFEKI